MKQHLYDAFEMIFRWLHYLYNLVIFGIAVHCMGVALIVYSPCVPSLKTISLVCLYSVCYIASYFSVEFGQCNLFVYMKYWLWGD